MTRTRLLSASVSLVVLVGCGSAPPPALEAPAQPGAHDDVASASGPRDEGVVMAAPADAPARVHPMAAPPPRVTSALAPPPPPAPVAARSHADKAPASPPAYAVAAPSAAVKAGEWDDNANYREFQKWLGTEDRQPYHHVDLRDRHFVVVRDTDGKALPRCPVVVRDARQHQVTLTTTARGRALLFPHAEGLDEGELTASTSCQGASAAVRFSLAESDGLVDLRVPVKRAALATPEVDLAFILDTTGSMGEEIAAVKSTIQKVSAAFADQSIKIRVGLVEYKDRGDEFVTKAYPMTFDTASFARQVGSLSAGGGGDLPESVNEGLHAGLTGLEWSKSAVARFAFLIGDAPPHLDYANDYDYAAEMRTAAHQGIQVFTVAASGMDDLGQVVFRQIAQYTGATNLFVLRGGAGPQSTGAGDPKSSCGGTQTQFVSGNLDALIVGKVRSELRGLDQDPLLIAGRNGDENAKPCAARLAVAR